MSGIVGWVSHAPVGVDTSRDFEHALQTLCHGARFQASVIQKTPKVLLGAVRRKEPPVEMWRDAEDRVVVIVYGRPLMASRSWRPAHAQGIAALYLRRGVEGLGELDGSFVLAILDAPRSKLYIFTDRTASIPLVHARGPRGFAFGPEAKCLFTLTGVPPRMSLDAAVSFLNLAYPVGSQTIFEGVHQLPAGSVLAVDLETSHVSITRWWDLRFEPREQWKRSDAVAALDSALEEAHRAVFSDGPERTHLLLTGGYDSRTVLGYMGGMGRPPCGALTWGVEPGLPGSDPAIAGEVAVSEGVPFRFLRYGAERFSWEASRWVWVGELSSDNLGNYATGPDFFEEERIDPEIPVVIGDQMLGPGGFPATHDQAIENITKIPRRGIRPELAAVLASEGVHAASESLAADLDAIVSFSRSDHPKDIQDYLYFHLYVVRWLHAPAYFREPMVSPRRPMLLAPVLEVGQCLPRKLRVDKAVLVDLLHRKMPRLARYPIASAHSLVDWDFEVRANHDLREFFLDLLTWEAVERTPLAVLLDRSRYLQAVDRFFSQSPRPVDRKPSQLPWAMGWRRRLAAIPWAGMPVRALEPLAKKVFGVHTARQTGAFFRRVALLALLQRMIDSGTFGRDGADSNSLTGNRGAVRSS